MGISASIFSGATEMSGELIELSESFCGQCTLDCTWLTGNNGRATKARKPRMPETRAVHFNHAGAVSMRTG